MKQQTDYQFCADLLLGKYGKKMQTKARRILRKILPEILNERRPTEPYPTALAEQSTKEVNHA